MPYSAVLWLRFIKQKLGRDTARAVSNRRACYFPKLLQFWNASFPTASRNGKSLTAE